MGETIINLARQIPNGMLIVFASYQLLEKTYAIWSKQTVLKRLEEIKPIIKEPKNSGVLNDRILQYIKLARSAKGAILMAVCRGKVSEGLDFSDELARAVLMVGIPFPPLYDRRVELKQRYLDVVGLNRVENKRRLTGKEWYLLQAIRAMNQAIGRVIRHKNDYGCVLFFDIRFNNSEVKREISSWIREEIKVFENFGHGYKEVLEFFRRKKQPTNITQLNKMLKNNDDNKNDPNNLNSIGFHSNNNTNNFTEGLNNNKRLVSKEEFEKSELKKIKNDDKKNNFQILDPMNELMAIDFDIKNDNNNPNLLINNKLFNNVPNSLESDHQSKPANSKMDSDTENIGPQDALLKKKSITINDLKNVADKEALRNCSLTIDSLEELQSFKDFLNQREKFECMICFVNKDELFSSKCGHMACLECWKRWLKEKLVCPKCKARVREKTLIRVFNN